MGKSSNWELLQSTRRAALFYRKLEGTPTYVVSIGNGKKPPPDYDTFKRDSSGNLIVDKSYWKYSCAPNTNHEEIKLGAEKLYLLHC